MKRVSQSHILFSYNALQIGFTFPFQQQQKNNQTDSLVCASVLMDGERTTVVEQSNISLHNLSLLLFHSMLYFYLKWERRGWCDVNEQILFWGFFRLYMYHVCLRFILFWLPTICISGNTFKIPNHVNRNVLSADAVSQATFYNTSFSLCENNNCKGCLTTRRIY